MTNIPFMVLFHLPAIDWLGNQYQSPSTVILKVLKGSVNFSVRWENGATLNPS